MKRIMPFLLLLFVTFSCSNSMLDSTDISIGVDLSELNLNYTSLDNLENNSKFKVSLYEVEKPEQVPVDYKSVDKSLYKMLASSYSSINDTKQASVVLNDIPVGINAFIIAEVFENDVDSSNVLYAGISKVFEVLPEKNIVDLELESCVIDEPVFTLEYKTQTEIVISTQKNIKAGTSIPLPQNIKLDELGIKGFGKFLGFYTDSSCTGNPITSVVVDKDITLYAKFEIIDYSITYKIDGATWNSYYTPNSSYNVLDAAISYIPKGEDLEKVGYTFEGWYKDADYKEKITSLEGLFEDITLYAKWTPILYNITYKLNEGTWEDIYRPFTDYTVEGITYLPSGNNLIKEGFVFDGWYDNPEYTGSPIDSLVGRTGDLTVYARWRDVNQVATVKFSPAADGVDIDTEIKLTCETDGATIHYTLDGTDPTEDCSVYNSAKPIIIGDILSDGQEEVTIKAYAVCEGMKESSVSTITYKLNVYTLNFDATGGTFPSYMQSSVQATSRSVCDFSNIVPTKTGCIFKGWYLSETPDATENPIEKYAPNIENTPNKTVTFYAKWEPITYTVVFDGNSTDASSMDPQEFKYDESKALNQNTFVRTGYTFTGWNTNADGTGTTYADKAVVSNLTYTDGERFTLYAQWQPNTASITVTLPTYTEISGLSEPKENDDNVVFTVSGYKSYAWYVNGDKQTATSSSFTFNTSSKVGGIYTIMLVVEDSNGNKYSAEWQVKVTK